MRGEILSYDVTTGDGLISGDDLLRYAFTTTAAGLEPGRRVDFVADGDYARDIIALSFNRFSTATTSAQSVTTSPVSWNNHFFSFKGRINRIHFWAVIFVLIGIQVPLWLQLFPVFWLLKAIVAAISLWPYLTALAKRLHDLNRSGALAIIPVVFSILLASVASFTWFIAVTYGYIAYTSNAGDQADWAWKSSKTVIPWLLGSAVLIQLVFIAWLGFMKGSGAENRFGPPPLK